MNRVLAMVLAMIMILSCLPTQYVKAEESVTDWATMVTSNPEQAYADAKALLDSGKATLVTASDWAVGGPYKNGDGTYAEGTKYFTNSSGTTMETVDDNGSVAVKITSGEIKANDYEGQANFKLLPDTVKANDKLFYAFKIKAISVNGSTEEGGVVKTSIRVRPAIDDSANGINGPTVTCAVGEDWKLVCGYGEAKVGTPVTPVAPGAKPFGGMIFQQGLYNEEFMVKDLCVINLSQTKTPEAETPGNDNTEDIPSDDTDDTPVEIPAIPTELKTALEAVSTGDAILLSDENWVPETVSGDVRSNLIWVSAGGSMPGKYTITPSPDNKTVSFVTTGSSNAAYDFQVGLRVRGEIKKDDTIAIAFRVKGTAETNNLKVFFRSDASKSDTAVNADSIFNNVTIGNQWSWCYTTVTSSADNAENGCVVIQAALAEHELEIGDFYVINLSRGISDDDNENGNEDDVDDDIPVVLPSGSESDLADALAKLEAKKATLLSAENWTEISSQKGESAWKTEGGSFKDTGKLAVTEVDTTAQEFEKAVHVAVTGTSAAVNDAQVCFRLQGPIKAGDKLFFAFKFKGTMASSSKIMLRPMDGNYSSDNNIVAALGNPSFSNIDNWTLVTGSVTALNDNGQFGALMFQLGLEQQEFEIADLYVINMSQGENVEEEAPTERFTYNQMQEKIAAGEATLVTYPNLSDEGAYQVNFQGNMSEENFKVELIDVENQAFTEALNIVTTELGNNGYSAEVFFNMDQSKPIKAGDILFYEVKVRGIDSTTNKEAYFVTANTRIRPDRATSSNFDWTSNINTTDSDSWETLYGACIAPADSLADGKVAADGEKDGVWTFQLAGAIQELDIAEVKVYNFGTKYALGQMPLMEKTYEGMDEDAQWRKDALERIEQIRKQDVSVSVVDALGNPIENAEVSIEQNRHEFGFGTIVNVDSYNSWTPENQKKYKELFTQFAHNRAGFENAMKHYYITNPERQVLIDEWLNYFEDNGMDVRGHVLIYGSDKRLKTVSMSGAEADLPNKAELTANTPEGVAALSAWTKNHIDTYAGKYKGRIYNWDVVNEDMSENEWATRISPEDHNAANAQWFKEARTIDPDVKLTYNDFGYFTRNVGRQDYNYALIQDLIEKEAPITTIGMQAHATLISPNEVLAVLDRFAGFGCDIEITEFTYEDSNEELQAQFTRDFMIAAFSHEAVTSFVTWGFWQGCMYQPKAAMVNNDFTLKPNGEVWLDLVYNQWWTDESGLTDSNGSYATRAFKGTHDITVKVGGVEQTYTVVLSDEPIVLEVVYADDSTDGDNTDDGNTGSGSTGSNTTGNSGTESGNAGSANTGNATTGSNVTANNSIASNTTAIDTTGRDSADSNIIRSGNTSEEPEDKVDVVPGEGVAMKVETSLPEFLRAVLGDAEFEDYKNGADVSVKVECDKIDTPDLIEKQAVESALGNSKVGQYFNIDLCKVIDGKNIDVSEINSPVQFTLDVPEELRGKDYTFAMIRVHNGVAALLADLDRNENTVTFETDLFSTYAMVYEEVEKDEAIEKGEAVENNEVVTTSNEQDTAITTAMSTSASKTGSNLSIAIILVIMIVCSAGVLWFWFKKKKDDKVVE